MTAPTDALGSAGRMPAAGRRARPGLPSVAPATADLGQGWAVGVGRTPVISAVDSAPSPPLPTRTPRVNWVPNAEWGVVTLDANDRAVRVVVGFDSPQIATGWARMQPGLDFRVLPTRSAPEASDWAVVELDENGRPAWIHAGFPNLKAADLHARGSMLPGYTVVPVDVYVPEPIPAGS